MFKRFTRLYWICAALVVTLTLCYIGTVGSDTRVLTLQEMPSSGNFDLYLLIGQSNMAGRAAVESRDRAPDPRILMLDDNDRWVRAIDPVHTDKSIAGVGLCRSFARALTSKNPSITIGLIPCAVGGSALSQWEAGGELYDQAVKRTLKAMESGTLRGILWHHGETDATLMRASQTYGDRLAAMIPRLRSDLHSSDVPLVVGQLGDFVVANPSYLFAAAINHDTREIPDRVKRTACVDPHGLSHRGDRIHFSREAVEELGKRYALAIEQLQSIHAVNATESGP